MSKVDNMEAELARIDKAGLENVYVPVWRLKKLLAVVRAAQEAVKDSFACGRVDPAEMYNALLALERDK